MNIYLEVGNKKVFAGSIDWPGWCRAGKDEASAMQSLVEYGTRYAGILEGTQLEFNPPENASQFNVLERLAGTSSTDFGAPDVPPSSDALAIDSADLNRFEALLGACWRAFDSAVQAASGKELRLGPRGGGRDLDRITRHVMEAEAAYLARMARRYKINPAEPLSDELDRIHQQAIQALQSAQRGELPESGPRGGKIWMPRYFVRRVAWHVLDHVWEIEDRIT